MVPVESGIHAGQRMASRVRSNAHPHVSGNCTRSGSGGVESEVVGVHNGIIENYAELKDKLLKHGYTFYSETDTEVVIKLVDYYYKKV